AASAPDLLVIDGAQGLTTADGRGLAELIPDLVEAGTTVVLGLPDGDVSGILTPETNYYHLDLDEARPAQPSGTDNEGGEHISAAGTNMEGVQSCDSNVRTRSGR